MKALTQVAKIALRGLGARKGRAALMMSGVAIGILTLTLVVAVTRGISAKVEKGVQAFGPDAIMVAAGSPQTRGPGDERVTTLRPEDLAALRAQVPGVRVAATMAGTLTLLLGIITLVALGAGALVLGNIMLVAVSERRAEIGLRRAVGATRVQIAQQFLVEGMIVTVLGGAAGVVLGTLAALVLGRLKVLPAMVSWQPFALALGVSLLVGALASLVPARRAAAVAITEALRP